VAEHLAGIKAGGLLLSSKEIFFVRNNNDTPVSKKFCFKKFITFYTSTFLNP